MSLDHEKLKQRRLGVRASQSGWRTKEGENRIRLLPPHSQYLTNWGAMTDIAVPYKVHFYRVEGRPVETGRCLEDLSKQRCPACEAWRLHRKSDDPGLKELAQQLGPADQYLMNMFDCNNLQAGIQPWNANFTCWDKMFEIVCNPQWGNVLDPADGVNFVVTMTPAGKSRSGYNAYSVMPEPIRTSILEVLATFPNWEQALDTLADHVVPPKELAEMMALIDEMGFPKRGGPATATPTAAPVGMAPTPVTMKPVPSVAPRELKPTAVAMPAPGPRPIMASVAPTGVARVHYDPGPLYVPKVPEDERPAGAPRCFGDYDPKIHQCRACPVMTPCQMKLVGVA